MSFCKAPASHIEINLLIQNCINSSILVAIIGEPSQKLPKTAMLLFLSFIIKKSH
jgi:hypothetical protein